MFFIISKILSFLISPIVWIFILSLLALRLKKYRNRLLQLSLILFYLFSNEFIYAEFMRAWEIKPRKPGFIKERYDAAIVLGGYATYDSAYEMPGFHESADRLLVAMQLYQTGKIDKILLAGGSASLVDTTHKEATVIKEYLLSLGIPDSSILVESYSKNTYENALRSAEILKAHTPNGRYLLITSGYHMRRALKCFQKTGLTVVDFSVDRLAGPRKFYFDHLFFPNASVFASWYRLFHEWIGYLVYGLKGYI